MNAEEIQGRLHRAFALRIPMFDPNASAMVKVGELEEYLRTTAYHRAELEEALHWGWEALKLLRDEWAGLEGWKEIAGRTATREDANVAKRVIAPGLWKGLQEAEDLVRDLDRQIKRLALDDAVASRSYTMLSGG